MILQPSYVEQYVYHLQNQTEIFPFKLWGKIQVLVLKPLCISSTGKVIEVGSREPHYLFLNPVCVQTSCKKSHCPGDYLGMKTCKWKLSVWICEVDFHDKGRTEFKSLHVPSVVKDSFKHLFSALLLWFLCITSISYQKMSNDLKHWKNSTIY